MDKGWIKLYRQIQDNMLWTSSEPFDRRSAWIDLIMMANIQTKETIYRGQVIKIRRGQVYTSIRKLAIRWRWSRDKVNRFIKALIEAHMIEHNNRTTSGTLLTIVKYDDFQNRADTNKTTNKSTNKTADKSVNESLLKNNKNDNEEKKKPSADPVQEEEEETWNGKRLEDLTEQEYFDYIDSWPDEEEQT